VPGTEQSFIRKDIGLNVDATFQTCGSGWRKGLNWCLGFEQSPDQNSNTERVFNPFTAIPAAPSLGKRYKRAKMKVIILFFLLFA